MVEGPYVRVEPNQTMLGVQAWDGHFGELVQAVFDLGAGTKLGVELDASARPTKPEEKVGASGLEGIAFYLIEMAMHEAMRLADRILDEAIEWIRRRRVTRQEVSVKIYGPNGEVLKSVLVDPDGGTRLWPA